jgi:signal transduction histidine kinase
MAYMLMAFTWWALLLFAKNKESFYAKRDLLEVGLAAQGSIRTREDFLQTAEYQELLSKHTRQEQMIFGEGLVFVVTLLAGLWFIHKSYSRQVRTNQQQRNFLLAITHELKSPIASIQLVLETLLKRELPKAQTERFISSGLKENERLLGLVENLLLSAKLETTWQPNKTPLDLTLLLEDLVAKMKEKHPDIPFTIEKSGTLPPVEADKSGMTSVFLNLLENAVKYAPESPEISAQLSATAQGVTVEIADQGGGIPDAEKTRIFKKFYRIGSEETRLTKGTGLGLFIAYQIVKAHQGQITVRDNHPKGTVFRVEMPYH